MIYYYSRHITFNSYEIILLRIYLFSILALLWIVTFSNDLSCKNTFFFFQSLNETLLDTSKYMHEGNKRSSRGLGTAASPVCRDCTFHGSFRR